MSHEAVAWALDQVRVKPAAKLVLVCLAERANRTGSSCHPGLTELARRTGMSRARVVEAIRTLEKIGAIQVHRCAVTAKRRGVNRYELAVGATFTASKASMGTSGTKLAQNSSGSGAPSRPDDKTRLVLWENQLGSPGGTGTSTKPPFRS